MPTDSDDFYEEDEELDLILKAWKRGKKAKTIAPYVYIDRMTTDDSGRIDEFTWAEARYRRPTWQRVLSSVIPAWRNDLVLRRYTDPGDLPF